MKHTFLKLRETDTRFWCSVIALILLSFSSFFWYLNTPIYDLLSRFTPPKTAANVILLDSSKPLSSEAITTLIEKLEQHTPQAILLLDPPAELAETPAKDKLYFLFSSIKSANDMLVSKMDHASFLSSHNALAVLIPYSNNGGTVRSFNTAIYQQAKLPCTECELVRSLNPHQTIPSQFLINYRLGQSSLPYYSVEYLMNNQTTRHVFKDKLLIVSTSPSNLTHQFHTNLFSQQTISLPYYIGSVIDNLQSNSYYRKLPQPFVAGLLLCLAFALPVSLQLLSLKTTLTVSAASFTSLILINAISLTYLQTFIPVIEPVSLFFLHAIFAINKQNKQVKKNLRASCSSLELALSETLDPNLEQETSVCASLYNLFNEDDSIEALSLFECKQNGEVIEALSLNTLTSSAHTLNELKAYLKSIPDRQISQLPDVLKAENLACIPILNKSEKKAIITLKFNESNSTFDASIERISQLVEQYQDEISDEVVTWLSKRDNQTISNASQTNFRLNNRLFGLSQQNDELINKLLNQHQKIKSNYNRLNSAVAIYSIYGHLISINESAEQFAKEANIAWYGNTLIKTLSDLSTMHPQAIKSMMSHVLRTSDTKRFTLKFDEYVNFLGTLSLRRVLSDKGDIKLTEKTFITLEITNVSNISKTSRLKHSYVSSITNQIKEDLNKLNLIVEKLSIVDQDSEKYHFLMQVIERINLRVKSSKEYFAELSNIESTDFYPVNITEKLEEAIKQFEMAFNEKKIKLVFDRPAFISHALLNYSDLEFVFSYLFELLLEDALHDSEITIKLNEMRAETNHLISIEIQNKGYGLPRDILEKSVSITGIQTSKPLQRCEQFAKDHGGEFHIHSTAGEGLRVTLSLPVNNSIH